MEKKRRKIYVMLDEDIFQTLWEYILKRWTSPTRKVHIVINEALREYLGKRMGGGEV